MFTRTGEFKSESNSRKERCICSCGKESWVVVKKGELTAKACAKCASFARMRSKPGDTTRICKKCGESKSVEEFCKDRNSKYLCLACKRKQGTDTYAADPEKVQNRIAAKYLEQRAFLNEQKNKPCQDCGNRFDPCQMDFDHCKGEAKVKDVSRMFHWAQDKILAEIAKCELVCSNCHRDRTQKLVETEYKIPGYGGPKPLRDAYVPKWEDVPLTPGCESRACKKCGQDKEISNFAPRGSSRDGVCRLCKGKNAHERGRRNIDILRKQRKERSDGMAEWFESLKDGQYCKDCNQPHPHWRLDFDHGSGKLYKPGRLKNSLHSQELVKSEIAKCELVCSNCHRLRTKNRSSSTAEQSDS